MKFKDKYWKPAMSDVLKVDPDFFPSNFCLNEFIVQWVHIYYRNMIK